MSYYGILHAPLRYDSSLQDFDKVLAADITAMSNKYGYCNASNAYFAEMFGKSKDTISRSISRLVKNGYFAFEIIYKKDSKEVKERRLHPTQKLTSPLSAKMQGGIGKNADTPIGKNAEGNTTRDNTTSKRKKVKKESPNFEQIETELNEQYADDLVEMKYPLNKEKYQEWLDFRRPKKPVSQKAMRLQIKKLCKYPADIQAQMIDQSIESDYQGLFEIKQQQAYKPKGEPEVGSIAWQMEQQRKKADAVDVEVV